MEQSNISIAIDGPAAAGKSTVARKIAKKLGYVYIDTGAMYRALTYAALEQKLDLEDEQAIYKLLLETPIELKQAAQGQRVFINDQDITEAIRQQHVSNHVSYVAKHPLVRREMVNRQQEMSRDLGVVMDGRDIGTHVLPEAEVKIFLIATVAERAKRRYEENRGKGMEVDLETLKKEIEQRDYIDSNREASPLVKAADAVEIDTTALDIDSVAEAILDEVYKVIG